MSSSMDSEPDFLGIYLNDHLAGATAGSNLAHRLAQAEAGDLGAELGRLDREIADDRDDLLRLMSELGVAAKRYKAAIGWVVEKAARLKSNGYVLRRSPLSTLLELETLRIGIQGKVAGWDALEAALIDPAQMAMLERLRTRAEEQLRTLTQLHREVAATVLAPARSAVPAAR
jgi:hypothetical protein